MGNPRQHRSGRKGRKDEAKLAGKRVAIGGRDLISAAGLRPSTDVWLLGILFLGLGLRLTTIDQPLIDHQAWRQTDTAAIARNYFEEGYELFYPRVDWRGATAGYVETNFPLYPFLVACTYWVLGGAYEWAGRLISTLFSVATGAMLYRFSLGIYGSIWTARLSALLFLVFPINIFFGRTFMPEAFMLFLSMVTLFTMDRWLETRRTGDFIWAVISAALCFLVKIPTLYLGIPLVVLCWLQFGRRFLRQPALWVYLLLVILPSVAWYAHAFRLFQETELTFGIWNRCGYDKWSNEMLLTWRFYGLLAERFLFNIFTPVGCLFIVLGLLHWGGRSREWVFHAWMGALVLYLFVIPEGNKSLHYYQMPFTLPGAVLGAKVLAMVVEGRADGKGLRGPLAWMKKSHGSVRVGVVIVSLLGIGWFSASAVQTQYFDHRLSKYNRARHAAGEILDRKLPEDALLVVGDFDSNAGALNRSQSPTMLYYCHRKGWQICRDEFSGALLDDLALEGATYFVVPGALVLNTGVFWEELLARGVSIPHLYPRFWSSERDLVGQLEGHQGIERNILIVQLGAKSTNAE